MRNAFGSLEVMTVLGPIRPEAMGTTYTHEQLLIDAYGHSRSYEYVIDDEEMIVQELREFTGQGFRQGDLRWKRKRRV